MEEKRLHVTATTIATYFTRDRCDRYLLLETTKKQLKDPRVTKNKSKLLEAQYEKGIKWEEEICNTVKPIYCPHEDGSKESIEWSMNLLTGKNGEINKIIQTINKTNKGIYIHGTCFNVLESFYEENKISQEKIKFSFIKPDFLYINILSEEENNKILDIQIIDAKASSKLKISHQIQVSFYCEVLENILSSSLPSLELDGFKIQINTTGGVWMPQESVESERRVGEITFFNRNVFKSVLNKVYKVLNNLYGKNGLDNQSSEWYFSPKCSLCNFKEICSNDTEKHKRIGSIPELQTGTQIWLTGLLSLAKKTNQNDELCEIEELDQLIQPNQPLNIQSKTFYPSEQRKLFSTLNSYPNGSSPVLKSILEKKIQNLRSKTLFLANEKSNIEIYLFILNDPKTELPICFSSYAIENNNQNQLKNMDYTNVDKKILKEFQIQICEMNCNEFICKFINYWKFLLDSLKTNYSEKTISFFIRTKKEKQNLLQVLMDLILLSKSSTYSKDAENIFLHLEDDVNCLFLSQQPNLLNNDNQIISPRIIILDDIISNLFAIPSSGYLEFNKSYYYLLPSNEKEKYSYLLHSQSIEEKIFEKIYENPQKENEISKYLHEISFFMQNSIEFIRFRSFKYCANTGELPTERLLAKPSKLNNFEILDYSHPILRMIVFIYQYELVLERKEYLEKRISGNQITNIPEIEIYQKDENDNKIFYGYLHNGIEFLSESSSISTNNYYLDSKNTKKSPCFYSFIGVENKNLYRCVSFNDFHFMAQMYEFKYFQPVFEKMSLIQIEKIDFPSSYLNNEKIKIKLKLKGYLKWSIGDKICLIPRVVNFNLNKIIKQAKKISNQIEKNKNSSVFINLISNPIKWGEEENNKNLIPSYDISLEKEQKLKKIYKDAANLAFSNKSSMINDDNDDDDDDDNLINSYSNNIRFLKFLRSQQRAFYHVLSSKLTLVWGPPGTGKTHFLALSILRLIEISYRCKIQSGFNVLVTAYTNTAIDKLMDKICDLLNYAKEVYKDGADGSGWIHLVDILRASSFSKTIPFVQNRFHIICSTCWQMKKISAKFSFDLLVVDEGSQLPVSASLLVIDKIKPTGRLIVAGDHHQLGPVCKFIFILIFLLYIIFILILS